MRWVYILLVPIMASIVLAQSPIPDTQPSTTQPTAANPSSPPSADQVLNQMLREPAGGRTAPLEPVAGPPSADAISGVGALAPNAPAVLLVREGTEIVDRVGRLLKTPDGTQEELSFESDGRAMHDPPMIILPNLMLVLMENRAAGALSDPRFRVSGMVTEYRGRNYILLEKVVVVQDKNQDF
jgi:hypothetical protein